MLRARRFEEALLDHAALIRGVFHVGIGQEATAAAVALARRERDAIMLNHRNHHHLAALGSDLEVMFREILGRDGGPQRGRAGTLHLADPGCGVPYTSAMVGGGVPIGLGIALARKRRREDGIAFCLFGDGAMGEGVLHECLNLAALWELPVVFVCESNAPRAGDRAVSSQSAHTLADIARAHRVRAEIVDATDARATAATLDAAAAAARARTGPCFIEARSVPWPGNRGFLPERREPLHLAGALGPASDVWDEADPVRNEVRALARDGVPLAEVEELDAAVRAEASRAVSAAVDAPLAPASAAFEHVWAPA
jgi:TPP-dependent pyruvate/acetoin dehydrogenase alpha subunit